MFFEGEQEAFTKAVAILGYSTNPNKFEADEIQQ